MTRSTEKRQEIRIAGVVVLYHPDEETYANIRTYLPHLEVLYALDNTENPEPGISHKIADLPHVKYIPFHDNKGLSFALNYALNQVDRHSCSPWIRTAPFLRICWHGIFHPFVI